MSSHLLPLFPPTELMSLNSDFNCAQQVDATEDSRRKWIEAAEQHGYKTFRTGEESPLKIYGLLKGGIASQPIALVSSLSDVGVENLAPFSSFLLCSADPPTVSFSVSRHPRYKNALANIKATKDYTINIVSEPWVEQANMASVDPEGVSEWDLCGLTKEQSTCVKAPRVKESAFVMELELLQDVDIFEPETGEVASTTIFGKVVAIHIRNDMFDTRGFLHLGKLRPIARLVSLSYASTEPVFCTPRTKTEESDTGEAMKDLRVSVV